MNNIYLQEAVLKEKANQNAKARLFEQYSAIPVGNGLKELAELEGVKKAHQVAHAMYKQETLMKADRLQEETISTQFGVKPEMVLRVVKIGTANSNISRMFNEYQLSSTDDAIYYVDPIYDRSVRGGVVADLAYEEQNAYYGSETEIENLGTGNGGNVAFSVTLSKQPVVPFKVTVLQAGIPVGSDNGSGIITGDVLDSASTNTVVYSTGEVTVTWSTAPVLGQDLSIEYNFNSELESNFDQYGVLDIRVKKDKFQVRPEPLSYRISAMSEILLETSGLDDNPINFLVQHAGQEHARMRDYRAIKRARRESLGNTITTFNADFAAVGEYSNESHAQTLWSTIHNVVMDVYKSVKRGGVATIIAGEKAIVYLQKNKRWVDDDTQPRFGVYLAGRIGAYEVFACPSDSTTYASSMQENEILVTLKGNSDAGDIAMAVGFLREISAQLTYPHFNTEGALAVLTDTKIINSDFFRLIRLENLSFN